ncbi:MAG: substrate-binding periplasmic protein [Pseudomonas sp.]
MVLSLHRAFAGVLLGLCTSFCLPAVAEQLVRVGAAYFPPYVFKQEQGEAGRGLLPQLLAALNQAQSEYRFIAVPTSLPRRYRDLEQGRVDMAIFENPQWGWQTVAHTAVDLGLEDAEVFVTRAVTGRDQDYFSTLQGKRLALYSGYHYAFAGFNAEPKFLAQEFNAKLTYSHDSNLSMVLKERAEIALVTRSYLSDFLARNREIASQFLVSARVDQIYHHYALLRPQAPISAQALSALLQTLRERGQLAEIFARNQIAVMPVAADSSVATDTTD